MLNNLHDSTDLERLNIKPKKTNIEKLLKEIHESAQLKIKNENETTLNLNLPTNISLTYIDETKIYRVITNILNNAIKATSNGEININVKDLDNGFIEINIEDNGCGIKQKDLKHIFELHYQGGNKKYKRGSGLGLFISEEIIKKHGGEIKVESELNEGTTFSFTLPIYKEKHL